MEKLVFGWERARIETIQRQADYLEILLRPTTASATCPVCEHLFLDVQNALWGQTIAQTHW